MKGGIQVCSTLQQEWKVCFSLISDRDLRIKGDVPYAGVRRVPHTSKLPINLKIN